MFVVGEMNQTVVIIVVQTFTISAAKQGHVVILDYAFHWPSIARFRDLFKFALTKLTAYYFMVFNNKIAK